MECRTLYAILMIALASFGGLSVARGDSAAFVETSGSTAIVDIIDKGLELERKEEWAEALTHYEDAVRVLTASELQSAKGKQLRRRLGVARLHFDLGRRYNDSSFYKGLRTVQTSQALDLYGEVLKSVDTHYVEQPDWNALLRNGTTGLSIALRDDEFRKVNRIRPSYESVRATIEYVWNLQTGRDFQSRQQAEEFVNWAAQEVSRRIGLNPTATILEFTCGATSSLDVYSTFLTGNELDEVYSQIEGNFVGLGVELKPDDNSLLIANVIAKGPAERAGIKSGDRIIEVDGKAIADISADRAADMLKGDEDSYVQVGVLSGDAVKRLYIRRERVEVPSVEDIAIIDTDDAIGYLRISSFQKTTYEDVNNALWSLHKKGMRTLIVDVRGNPGGLLTESVEVSDLFIKRGSIVETRGRSARENSSYRAHESGTWRVPLVVLIDNDSASASEIFAGAIRDHGAGTVVGTRSYGKGSVQGIFPLRTANAGVKLTTAKFYSPSGRTISGNGVEPEITVRSVARPTAENADEQNAFVDVEKSESDLILEAGKKAAVQRMMAVVQNHAQSGR